MILNLTSFQVMSFKEHLLPLIESIEISECLELVNIDLNSLDNFSKLFLPDLALSSNALTIL